MALGSRKEAPNIDSPGQVGRAVRLSNSALSALHPQDRTLIGRFAHVRGLVYLRQIFVR
jgi:hypothetical protein